MRLPKYARRKLFPNTQSDLAFIQQWALQTLGMNEELIVVLIRACINAIYPVFDKMAVLYGGDAWQPQMPYSTSRHSTDIRTAKIPNLLFCTMDHTDKLSLEDEWTQFSKVPHCYHHIITAKEYSWREYESRTITRIHECEYKCE